MWTPTKRSSGQSVAVAVSGGVDSSTTAYLLKRHGYQVTGVFITIRNPAHITCTSSEDRQHAMRACAVLGIPFLDFDATAIYQERVLLPFVESYRKGETPNPDVLCNRVVKFGVLSEYLFGKGFSLIATGHYAKVCSDCGEARLFRSVDEEKDQTYFIYEIAPDILTNTLFPLGDYTKQQVRSLAKEAGLPAAERKDSVGLCFLGDVSLKEVLSAYLPIQQGVVERRDGTVIGEHDGAWFYTLGQRHGFRTTATTPQVVVQKKLASNVLVVDDTVAHAKKQAFHLTDVILRRLPEEGLVARYRHRGPFYPVSVSEKGSHVSFAEPQPIAPGQSIVLYTADGECLGGGVVST